MVQGRCEAEEGQADLAVNTLAPNVNAKLAALEASNAALKAQVVALVTAMGETAAKVGFGWA